MSQLRSTFLGFAAALALAGAAAAAPIDTTGTEAQSAGPFGSPNTATYGQTFTPDATQTNLTSFSLFLLNRFDGSGTLDLRGYVATWDGNKAGTILFESATQTMNAAGTLQEFAFSTNLMLTAGLEYVAFLSVSDLGSQPTSVFEMPLSGDAIPGQFVFLNNGTDFDFLTTDDWSAFGATDAWFKAGFGEVAAVPAPAALSLFGLGLLGLAVARRRATA